MQTAFACTEIGKQRNAKLTPGSFQFDHSVNSIPVHPSRQSAVYHQHALVHVISKDFDKKGCFFHLALLEAKSSDETLLLACHLVHLENSQCVIKIESIFTIDKHELVGVTFID